MTREQRTEGGTAGAPRRGPLAGLRVVDFTHILAGPYCTQCLADAGADVLKVEPPTGEYGRVRGARRTDASGNFITNYCAAVNRGKRSIALDLKNPAGLEVALRLIDAADVVVENFAPGALTKLGIDLKAIQEERPSLITVSISLFGQSAGALATRAGLAVVAEGESSITGMTTDASGKPVMLGFPLGDMAAALSAYAGIVTSLLERTTTGVGRHLDISMVKALWAFNSGPMTANQFDPSGVAIVAPAGYGVYEAADGYVTLGVNSDSLFARLAHAIGRAELSEDPRYASFEKRDAARDDVNAIISDWMGPRSVAEVVERISAAGVPCGRIATVEDVLGDPELRALGLVETLDDTLGGTVDSPANPFGFQHGSKRLPQLGADTHDALAEVGIEGDEVERLRARGAFGPPVG